MTSQRNASAAAGDAEFIDLTVATGSRPMTLNAERSKHWAVAGKQTAAWRLAAAEAWLEAGLNGTRWERCRFQFLPTFKRGPLPDTGAVFPVEKAIIDGLVDMGFIEDDTGEFNTGQLSLPPIVASLDAMRVRLVNPDH